MGREDKLTRPSERSSARLLTRNLSLSLGYTPAPDLITAYQSRTHHNSYRPALDSTALVCHLPIQEDINLERVGFSYNASAMADDERFSEIETNVTGLKTDVMSVKTDVSTLKSDVSSINEKMDALIQAMNRMDTNKSGPSSDANSESPESTTVHQPPEAPRPQVSLPNQPQAASHPLTQNSHITHHTAHHRTNTLTNAQPTYLPGSDNQRYQAHHVSPNVFIQREMERDKFVYPEAGKNNSMNEVTNTRVMTKPYMFLYRDGISTMKQKLDVRHTMSAAEYTDALLALLSDRRAYDPKDFHDIFHHLRKVTRDTLERPWPAVRRWTQYIWDAIEDGSITWSDSDVIQEERVRMCLTSQHAQPLYSQNSAYQIPARRNQGLQELACRAFNTRNGCHHRDSHPEGSVFLLHICTYCDSVGKACYHSVRDCERRVTHSRNDNQFNQARGRPQNHSNQFQQNHYQYNSHNPSAPKNGL